MSAAQRPVDESNEELRALSFVRKSLLKKNELIRQLKKQLKDLREEVENLKWKCSNQEKEIERIFSGDNAVTDETECDISKESSYDIQDVSNKDLVDLPLETTGMTGESGMQEFLHIKEEEAEPNAVLPFDRDESLTSRGKRSHKESVNSFSKQMKRPRTNSHTSRVDAVIDESGDHALDENYLLNHGEVDPALLNQPTEQPAHLRLAPVTSSLPSSHHSSFTAFGSVEGAARCPHENCTFTSDDIVKLRRHLGHAHGDLAFACPEPGCGHRTKWKHALDLHLMRHRGLKPYGCPYEGCAYRAAQRATVKRHIKSHSFYTSNGSVGRAIGSSGTTL